MSKKNLKILIVTTTLPAHGKQKIYTFVEEQVESLLKNYPDLSIDFFTIRRRMKRYISVLEYFRAIRPLLDTVKRNRYDIVHAHFGLTLLSMLFVNVPVVVTFHGSDLNMSPMKHISKLLARKASKSIVVSKMLKNELGYGEVIPCGIYVERFLMPSDGFAPSSSVPSNHIRILFPANPALKIKNYELFEAVCQELEKKGNKIERVHLMNIEREKVPQLYWNCDLMLLTSLSEGSPTVIKEAIAAKLPFVSVDVGDTKEWAELVEFGVVTPDRDPKTIADATLALLNRIKDRRFLDNSKCLEAMDITNIAGRIRRVYYELSEGK